MIIVEFVGGAYDGVTIEIQHNAALREVTVQGSVYGLLLLRECRDQLYLLYGHIEDAA